MLRIVIADDELPILEWVKYCLKENDNWEIAGAASDGLQAYDMIIDEKPDVVITDIRMPRMDGISVMKSVKEILPQTEFIILTNHADFSYAKQAITWGAKEYILKSELRSSELIGMLEDIEENQDAQQGAPRTHDDLQRMAKKTYIDDPVDHHENNKSVEMALDFIHEHFYESISLTDVANHVYRSPEYFSRLFKEITGENFSTYLINYRLGKARSLLMNTDLKVTDISYRVGYQNPSYFSRLYKKYMGVTPEGERKRNRKKAK